MSTLQITSEFDSTPTVGQYVTGRSRINAKRTTTWGGTYTGVQASEWDGTPMHMFTDGVMGETPQATFGLPVTDFPTTPAAAPRLKMIAPAELTESHRIAGAAVVSLRWTKSRKTVFITATSDATGRTYEFPQSAAARIAIEV